MDPGVILHPSPSANHMAVINRGGIAYADDEENSQSLFDVRDNKRPP